MELACYVHIRFYQRPQALVFYVANLVDFVTLSTHRALSFPPPPQALSTKAASIISSPSPRAFPAILRTFICYSPFATFLSHRGTLLPEGVAEHHANAVLITKTPGPGAEAEQSELLRTP